MPEYGVRGRKKLSLLPTLGLSWTWQSQERPLAHLFSALFKDAFQRAARGSESAELNVIASAQQDAGDAVN